MTAIEFRSDRASRSDSRAKYSSEQYLIFKRRQAQ
ncbi:phage polarity suppression protein [Enterobacter sp. CC120223-11]|nr:phage polarity suppression protein [Enterobacter sp. CC120223-11]